MRKTLAAFVIVLASAGPVLAQDKLVEVNFGGGGTVPVAGLKDSFNTGWNGGIGVTFNFTPMLGIQAEYMYNRMDGPSKTVLLTPTPVGNATGSGIIESNHQMHVGTFNLVAKAKSQGMIGGYVLGGGGIYHREVELTSPAVGYGTICDPYWLVCYPTPVAMDRIIGTRSSNDFGINFGGGITFGSEDVKFYVEARYHYVWGPSYKDVNGVSQSSNAEYIPFTFGLRF